jgi:coenzyme F420-reducing hydrogenase beta subunit
LSDNPTFQRILEGGYCIGCGVCAGMAPDRLTMQFDRYGALQPVSAETGLTASEEARVLQVCPFSDRGPHEDELAARLFPEAARDGRVGAYTGLYAGYAKEGSFRVKGSSGGMVSWVLAELLRTGMVDGVLHVVPATREDRLFAYDISTSVDAVLEGAKSKYYPIELSDVLQQVKAWEGRFALVGVPCFIKAVRRLALQDETIRNRIVFYVGLVCGHLKSKAFADCFAWQAGISPGKLEAIDFRVKLPDRPASQYGVMVKGGGIEKTTPADGYFGSNWGYGFFKYSACEYCDDVFAETADVAIGDAWLPGFTADSKGNSVVVARAEQANALLLNGRDQGRLELQDCPLDAMVQSQAGGLRHRRDGLAVRLAMKRDAGVWVPGKRVSPCVDAVPARRRMIYRLREELRAQSHEYWLKSVKAGSFPLFQAEMQRLVRRYNRVYAPLISRVGRKLYRLVRPRA